MKHHQTNFKLIIIFIIISMSIMICACDSISSLDSLNAFSIKYVLFGKSGANSNIQASIVFNRDMTVMACQMVYLDESGKEYKLDWRGQDTLTKTCTGPHYAGGNIQIVGDFNTDFSDKKGTVIVTLYDKTSKDGLNYDSYTVKYFNENVMLK